MTLADAVIGQIVTVTEVGGERGFRRRLMELGLVPGTRIELAGVAPLGDPLKLLVRGCFLSIRKSEAACVEVFEEANIRANETCDVSVAETPERSGVRSRVEVDERAALVARGAP